MSKSDVLCYLAQNGPATCYRMQADGVPFKRQRLAHWPEIAIVTEDVPPGTPGMAKGGQKKYYQLAVPEAAT